MLSVIFGLSAALSFGASDFLGGLSSRHIGSLRTVWVAASTSLVIATVGSLILTSRWSAEALIFGGLSGISAVIALAFLFASLAIGPMSILSPIGAVFGALLPALWDFFAGESLSWLAYLAIALVLVAVVIVGFSPEENAVRPSIRGVIFSVLAGAGFATYYVLLDLAPDDAGLTPLVANRAVSALLATCAVVAVVLYARAQQAGMLRRIGRPRADMAVGERGVINWRKGLPIALFVGAIEAVGTTLVLYGLASGNLTIVAVLTSLYPAGTIVLATIILHERIGKLQYFGLVLALTASVTLAFV